MKAEEFCRLRKQYSLPYADQKVILEGCFSSSIESVRRNPDTYFDDEKAKKVLNKIGQGYPANYLAGYRDVQHLHLFLNEDTLIPRNETIWFVFDYLVYLLKVAACFLDSHDIGAVLGQSHSGGSLKVYSRTSRHII